MYNSISFNELLDKIINTLHCSASDLAKCSKISDSLISRYRSGARVPSIDSIQLNNLIKGLVLIANEKNIPSFCIQNVDYNFDIDTLSNLFSEILATTDYLYGNFSTIFDRFINELKINMNNLSVATNYDISFLYRVRSNLRHPNNLLDFINIFIEYIVNNHCSNQDLEIISNLINVNLEELKDIDTLTLSLKNYFMINITKTKSIAPDIDNFLKQMDDFDLGEYIKVIHFDELKIPTIPFQMSTSKKYYGIDNMRKAELDFFKITVTSKTSGSIFMCNNMPMTDMAEDMDFNKKWMFAIAASIKKGLHINIIHDVERPIEELMLGLEAWIPIYMTGQVTPYHFPNYTDGIFRQLNYCSGVAALYGECINEHHDDGMYYLTNNKHEINYYSKKLKHIFSNAKPLMNIYNINTANKYSIFFNSILSKNYDWKVITSSLPLYTISEELLKEMISNQSKDIQKTIIDFYENELTKIKKLLINNEILLETSELTMKDFKNNKLNLYLTDSFIENEIPYTYDQYKNHLESTKNFAAEHTNYNINFTDSIPFKNIHIRIAKGNFAIVSKLKSPMIHFVIKYPTLVNAFENFEPKKE